MRKEFQNREGEKYRQWEQSDLHILIQKEEGPQGLDEGRDMT